ncbi:hypothetical protein [Gilliamella sp. Pas-s95]|uniref:hypothetical protein n=1 Tax=Gilliamella sp. Pas-s95 TaxID=2687317 RepID=UPI001326A10E|nr:hypothetical protein [Gilliamella sp. Pas-s95]MWN05999.1 hypothetical protein [Gilliamella sp. Pas-s95]
MASGIWHLACQTYALNLFHFCCSLNQTQFLFLSPKLSKSLHLAKSPCLSAGLSPRPRHLSFLSKLPDLLKLFRLPKLPLFFVLLLLLSYAQCSMALTANTSKEIEGSAPYLTFDGGQTKATDTDSFLSIELPDGRVITPSTNTSSATNPIRLPSGNYTFNDIHTVLPSGTTSISLNSLITQGKWGDDDGDGQGAGGVTASGSISLAIKDKDGTTVSRGDTLSKCSAPYKITLSSTGGSLTTQYGVPNISTFIGGSVEYYIKPDSSGGCYFVQSVRPNLNYGIGVYAGPSNIWSSTKGFLVQSTNPSSYDRNFPTTGADGLYFDLDIEGIDASQLNWTVNTSGSLGATVSWTRPLTGTFTDPLGNTVQADQWITDKSKNVTRVTLHGPKVDSAQISSSSPGSLARPSLPQTFELVGRDSSSGNEIRYGFVLRQWFVNRGNKGGTVSDQTAWCNSLGYRLPQVKDLTNAVKTSNPPISGAAPSSSGNYYMRHIGAGFLTEWGLVSSYADAGFFITYFWSSDVKGSNGFYILSSYGMVFGSSVRTNFYAVCTTP